MTTQEVWDAWSECKDRLKGAEAYIHEQFEEDWADEAIRMFSPEQRVDLAMYMRDMAQNWEDYGLLHGEPA